MFIFFFDDASRIHRVVSASRMGIAANSSTFPSTAFVSVLLVHATVCLSLSSTTRVLIIIIIMTSSSHSWRNSYALILVVAIVAMLAPTLVEKLAMAPRDERMGQIPIMTLVELQQVYRGKRVLIVGGSRGVGLGTALAVARAGAHVTIVGRSLASGQAAVDQIQQESTSSSSPAAFVAGDIGSLASSHQLVADLEEHAKQKGKFDFLVVTAAVFPDWSKPHQQEDGIDNLYCRRGTIYPLQEHGSIHEC
jgi:short chain dehydrogenase